MPGARESWAVLDSPVGPITLIGCDGSLAGLYLDDRGSASTGDEPGPADAGLFADAAAQLEAYFAGHLVEFDLPLIQRGTPFQRAVWTALRAIPYGQTTSYGRLAHRLGQPAAARAVGLACGRNPIGIVVPCHRVVGSTGRLTGYAGGLTRKRQLLELELRQPALF